LIVELSLTSFSFLSSIRWTGKQYVPNIVEGKAAGCKRVRGVLCMKKAEAGGNAARIQAG
jgi:hypothetical protein